MTLSNQFLSMLMPFSSPTYQFFDLHTCVLFIDKYIDLLYLYLFVIFN